MLPKNGWYVWTTNLRSVQRNSIWKLGVLNTCWKEPWKPENETHATAQVLQAGDLLPPVFLKAFILLSFCLLQAQSTPRIIPFKYSKIFQCTCDSGVWEPEMGCLFFRACQELWGCSSWKPKEGPCCGKGGHWNGGMQSPAERGPRWWRGPSSR